jgi:hypothetical protein
MPRASRDARDEHDQVSRWQLDRTRDARGLIVDFLLSILSNNYVVAAIISAAASILVNVIYNFVMDGRRAKRERQNAFDLAAVEARHQKELEKYKRQLDDLAERRAEREKLIKEFRELLPEIRKAFIEATQLSSKASEDAVIEQAHITFAVYGRYRHILSKLEGRIRKTHFKQLSELRGVLVRVCLDMALEPSERKDPARLARLADYRKRISAFCSNVVDVLETVLVPWDPASPNAHAAAVRAKKPSQSGASAHESEETTV